MALKRDPKFYQVGSKAKDLKKAPLIQASFPFDRSPGKYQLKILEKFNKKLRKDFPDLRLKQTKIKKWPKKIVIINASIDNLPTSPETKRVFDAYLKKNKINSEVKLVNTEKELLAEVKNKKETLVFSQAVSNKAYNLKLAQKLINQGLKIAPGKITAAGHISSNKAKTFKMLMDNKNDYSRTAKFVDFSVNQKTTSQAVDEIFKATEKLAKDFNLANFFIKPKTGGGGLGGWQLKKMGENKYFLPDLSRLDSKISEVKPYYLYFNPKNLNIVKELLWIYKIFSQDKQIKSSYIKTKLNVNIKAFQKYLNKTNPEKQNELMIKQAETKKAIKQKLIKAINNFEKKFKVRYEPVVNEYLNYGRWGFRTHYRLTKRGLELDTVYARLFQIAFFPQGIAYVGIDNISNKQTGELEPVRLQTLNPIMIESANGLNHLYKCVYIGAQGMQRMIKMQDKKIQSINPFRAEVDLAPVSQRIGEINGDSARGLVLGSNFNDFVKKTEEWLKDGVGYYNIL